VIFIALDLHSLAESTTLHTEEDYSRALASNLESIAYIVLIITALALIKHDKYPSTIYGVSRKVLCSLIGTGK
jgi:hypothetical protein